MAPESPTCRQAVLVGWHSVAEPVSSAHWPLLALQQLLCFCVLPSSHACLLQVISAERELCCWSTPSRPISGRCQPMLSGPCLHGDGAWRAVLLT